MSTTPETHVDETHLNWPDLLRRIESGEEVVIEKNGVPIARLLPAKAAPKPRVPGLNRGQIWMADDFDEPLPDSFWLGEGEDK